MSIETVKGHTEPAVMPVVIVAPSHRWGYVFTHMAFSFLIWTLPVAGVVQAWLLAPLGLHWDFWTTLGAVFALRALLSRVPLYQAFGEGTVGKGRRFFA